MQSYGRVLGTPWKSGNMLDGDSRNRPRYLWPLRPVSPGSWGGWTGYFLRSITFRVHDSIISAPPPIMRKGSPVHPQKGQNVLGVRLWNLEDTRTVCSDSPEAENTCWQPPSASLVAWRDSTKSPLTVMRTCVRMCMYVFCVIFL